MTLPRTDAEQLGLGLIQLVAELKARHLSSVNTAQV